MLLAQLGFLCFSSTDAALKGRHPSSYLSEKYLFSLTFSALARTFSSRDESDVIQNRKCYKYVLSVKKLSGGAKDEKGVGRKKPSRSIASNRSVRHRRGENTQSLQACVQRTAFSKFIICLSFSNTAKKE